MPCRQNQLDSDLFRASDARNRYETTNGAVLPGDGIIVRRVVGVGKNGPLI